MRRKIPRKWAIALTAVFLAVSITASGAYVYLADDEPVGKPLTYFASQEEFESYLEPQYRDDAYAEGGSGIQLAPSVGMGGSSADSDVAYAPSANSIEAKDSHDFSSTNVQVAGVDEADIVKTDGEYIYTVSGDSVKILRAYPAESAELLSEISCDDAFIKGIFVYKDRLAVISDGGQFTPYYYYAEIDSPPDDSEPQVQIIVYDISDRAEPREMRDVRVSGSYTTARMIDSKVYVISDHFLSGRGEDYTMPSVWDDGERRQLTYKEIAYFEDSKGSGSVAMVLGLDVTDDEAPFHEAILKSWSQTTYVSAENIYLTGYSMDVYYSSFEEDGRKSEEVTNIHKLSIARDEIIYLGSGKVTGRLLNQFSMDEHEGHLRVATTIGNVWDGSTNNVYILDEEMTLVGSLEGLAPGERIYSVRFMGDRGYLVTFKKVDPFFVIDLEDPKDPKVLGYLKIPGFSEYMHPLDENHIIGIGKDTEEADGGNFAWFQGVKLSLFDVTDVENPKEVSKMVIGDRGSDSEALFDHKAFSYFPRYDMIVIPVTVLERESDNVPPYTYGSSYWQGAYVIHVTPEDGFILKGKIEHDVYADEGDEYYYSYYDGQIRRSLYIEDTLYTISDYMVKMNDITTLEEKGQVSLRSDEVIVDGS